MRLTREQAAIIGIFTGICCGPFEDIQKLADELVGYPTLTHMFGDCWSRRSSAASISSTSTRSREALYWASVRNSERDRP